MSETKEYSIPELIEFLDTNKPSLEWWLGKKGKAKLAQIKGIVKEQYQHEQNILDYGTDEPEEQQEQPVDQVGINKINSHPIPQPDEDLLEKIWGLCMNHASYIGTEGHKNQKKESRKRAKAELRKLLPPRPSVTREEIQELIHIIGEFTIVGTRREDIDIWFKLRGIEVKEKP